MWVVEDLRQDEEIIQEIGRMDDRPAAIIASCYLERSLERALRGRLLADKKIADAFLKGMGPLSSFSSRIDLAYLLGLISTKEAYGCFHAIRRARNCFAHELTPTRFSSAAVVKASKGLLNVAAIASSIKTILPQLTGVHASAVTCH